MGLIISRAEASYWPQETQTLVELKRKTGCKCMSVPAINQSSHPSPTGAPSPQGEELSAQGPLGPNPILG